MWLCRLREEPWVPNVRCQVCIFRPLWDADDYHGNYSAFEQSVFCAEHWEAHLPRDLMLVFVCHHKHECVSQGYRRRNGRRGGVKAMKIVQCLQFSCDKLALPCFPIPLSFLSAFSYPWFLLALKRLGWKWSRYQSSLSPSWGRAGSCPGFPLFMVSSPLFCFPTTFCASFYALCIFWGQLLWFNMHDKFYSYVHTHYPLDWTPPSQTLLCWQGNATLWMASRRVGRPPPSFKSLTLWLESDPNTYTHTPTHTHTPCSS